jgi:rfaE bifunctional protein nucleotidyltransferase chain/domain
MLVPLPLLVSLREQFRAQGKTVVFTNGCFDILHVGHAAYLAAAKRLGDVLIVGVNSDDSVRRLKGSSRPVNGEHDRATLLAALKSVDYVTMFTADTPFDLIAALKPDVLAKGGDYTPDTIVGADIVRLAGGSVAVIPFVEGKSTTHLVEKIRTQQ